MLRLRGSVVAPGTPGSGEPCRRRSKQIPVRGISAENLRLCAGSGRGSP